jgi:hypothetical protein
MHFCARMNSRANQTRATAAAFDWRQVHVQPFSFSTRTPPCECVRKGVAVSLCLGSSPVACHRAGAAFVPRPSRSPLASSSRSTTLASALTSTPTSVSPARLPLCPASPSATRLLGMSRLVVSRFSRLRLPLHFTAPSIRRRKHALSPRRSCILLFDWSRVMCDETALAPAPFAALWEEGLWRSQCSQRSR